jgi:hypothetical protein
MDTIRNTIEKLEFSYKEIIDKNSLTVFSSRIELGEDLEGEKRINQGLIRSRDIFNFVFENDDIWIRLILWDIEFLDTYNSLVACGFKFDECDNVYEVSNPVGLDEYQLEDTKVCYLHYKKFEFEKIKPLLSAIFTYELDVEPSANVSAVFLKKNLYLTLINPYDDRGLDILTNNSSNFDKINEKFDKWK